MSDSLDSRASAPILDELSLLAAIARERAAGKSIAFANGIFDLLHVGHVRYLGAASRVADVLVVGINSDASTRRLKGESRPVIPEAERAEIVASLRGVAYVTIFSAETPADLIAALKPDFHCKGTDYTAESVPERGIVESYGGRVVIVGDAKDHSTTEMMKRVKR
ncbi:MAG TPA: adenylyltransferase/cytidyltransferase family protein [Thermoanaerobaculia bacterium]|nr:adenylyltransferase/cytidyltransferase family protein [Thermoanaerobaculia bacterium]